MDATETATNGIIENLEGIDEALDKLRESGAAPELCDAVSTRTMAAMANCTLPVITGQRLTSLLAQ